MPNVSEVFVMYDGLMVCDEDDDDDDDDDNDDEDDAAADDDDISVTNMT